MTQFLDRFFKISERNSSLQTELIAGITNFMTIAYMLVVIPGSMAAIGMPQWAVFTATGLTILIATLLVGVLGNFPFTLAPSLGLNSFFAFSIVLGMGKSWQFALSAGLISSVILLLLTLFRIRELLFNVIPANLKTAMVAGIGMFIAFIGLKSAGIVQAGGAVLAIGDLSQPGVYLALLGIFLIAALEHYKVKGAYLISIIVITLIGIPFGLTQIQGNIFSIPPSLSETAFKFVPMNEMLSADMAVSVFTFLFVAIFDTIGTLVGLGVKANLLDENGTLKNINRAYLSDSIGGIFASCLGTSIVGTTVESSAGIAEGGRTGLSAVTTSVLMLIALFLSSLFLAVPSAATAPVLVSVGLSMVGAIQGLDLSDSTLAIPALLTVIAMPLSYSIADGIMIGVISYTIINLISGKGKEVSAVMYVLTVLFLLYIFLL